MSTLHLSYTVGEAGRVDLRANRVSSDGGCREWGAAPDLFDLEGLRAMGHRFWAALQSAADDAQYAETVEEATELVRGTMDGLLIPLGDTLRRMLLPDDLLTRWLADAGIRHVVFEIDPRLNGIPFEAIRVGEEFVGFEWSSGRRVQTCSPPQRPRDSDGPLVGFSLIDPGDEIGQPSVVEEFERFCALPETGVNGTRMDWSRWRIGGATTVEEVRDVFRSHSFINVVAHHDFDGARPERSGFRLGGDRRFTAEDLVAAVKPGGSVPRLVVAVACESGVTRGWETRWTRQGPPCGFVDAGLRVGIPHFVAAGVRIPHRLSTRLLAALYGCLGRGQTLGEALREARRAFRARPSDPRDGGTVWGLSFLLFGEPAMGGVEADGRWRVPRDAADEPPRRCHQGHSITGNVFEVCQDPEQTHPGERRVVCPAELGFGRGLCDECREVARDRRRLRLLAGGAGSGSEGRPKRQGTAALQDPGGRSEP